MNHLFFSCRSPAENEKKSLIGRTWDGMDVWYMDSSFRIVFPDSWVVLTSRQKKKKKKKQTTNKGYSISFALFLLLFSKWLHTPDPSLLPIRSSSLVCVLCCVAVLFFVFQIHSSCVVLHDGTTGARDLRPELCSLLRDRSCDRSPLEFTLTRHDHTCVVLEVQDGSVATTEGFPLTHDHDRSHCSTGERERERKDKRSE